MTKIEIKLVDDLLQKCYDYSHVCHQYNIKVSRLSGILKEKDETKIEGKEIPQ